MHSLETIHRLNDEASQETLDRAVRVVIDYLTDHSRVRDVNGRRSLEILRDGQWVKVFVPSVPGSPKGFSTVRSA